MSACTLSTTGQCGGITKARSVSAPITAFAKEFATMKKSMVEVLVVVLHVTLAGATIDACSCSWMSLDATVAGSMLKSPPQTKGFRMACTRFPMSAIRNPLKRLMPTPLWKYAATSSSGGAPGHETIAATARPLRTSHDPSSGGRSPSCGLAKMPTPALAPPFNPTRPGVMMACHPLARAHCDASATSSAVSSFSSCPSTMRAEVCRMKVCRFLQQLPLNDAIS